MWQVKGGNWRTVERSLHWVLERAEQADTLALRQANLSLRWRAQSVPSGPVTQQLPFSVSALRNACAQGGRGDSDRRELCCENRKCPSVSQQLENSPHAHTKKYYAADL